MFKILSKPSIFLRYSRISESSASLTSSSSSKTSTFTFATFADSELLLNLSSILVSISSKLKQFFLLFYKYNKTMFAPYELYSVLKFCLNNFYLLLILLDCYRCSAFCKKLFMFKLKASGQSFWFLLYLIFSRSIFYF